MALNISNSLLPLQPCPASTPLYNGTKCIACSIPLFYDLRSLKCIASRLVSNVAALNATNKTISIGIYNLSSTKKQIATLVLPFQLCPASKPLYNGSQCVACPPNQYYLLSTLKCYTPLFSSNVTALKLSGKVVQVGNHTVSNLNVSIISQAYPTKPCPASIPFLSQGKCIACLHGLYYDLQNGGCYKPKFASNTTELLITNKTLNVGNTTLTALNNSIVNSPYPSIPCPKAAPLFNGSACTYCPKGTYYNLHNLSCYSPRHVSNVSALSATHKVLPFKGITLAVLNATIKAIILPVF